MCNMHGQVMGLSKKCIQHLIFKQSWRNSQQFSIIKSLKWQQCSSRNNVALVIPQVKLMNTWSNLKIPNLRKTNEIRYVPVKDRYHIHKGEMVKYRSEENGYLHSVLESLPEYFTHLLEKRTSGNSQCETPVDHIHQEIIKFNGAKNEATSTVIEILETLLNSQEEDIALEMSSPEFESFTLKIVPLLKRNGNSDLVRIITLLSQLPFDQLHRKIKVKQVLWMGLDELLTSRTLTLDMKEVLKLLDFFYLLHFSPTKSMRSIDHIFNKIQIHLDDLSKIDLVSLMMAMCVIRKGPPDVVTKIEQRICESMKNTIWTVEEMMIVCLGLFKSRNKLTNPSLHVKLLRQAIKDYEQLTSICKGAIIKITNYSVGKFVKKNDPEIYKSILDLFTEISNASDQLENLEMVVLNNIMLLSMNIGYVDANILKAYKTRVMHDDMAYMRVKEIARILHISASFRMNSQEDTDLCLKFLNELESPHRELEASQFPESILQALVALSYEGIYSVKLQNQLFSSKSIAHLKRYYSKYFVRDLFQLDCSISIERPSYNGNRLPENILQENMIAELKPQLPNVSLSARYKQSTREGVLLDIYAILNYIFVDIEGEFMKVHPILPHFPKTPEIEIRYKGSLPIPIEEWSKEEYTEKVAIVIFSPTSFYQYQEHSTDGTSVPSWHLYGISRLRLRQLELLGYRVIQMNHFDLNRARNQKKYVETKIFPNYDDSSLSE
ncbi:unnamed protein product [Owenia fusiformis]|uniref:Uncharacterized protein n=1 Tax=Owenia fusiformis TaxID=6347 RepID=A0A8J1TV68_OWEFU|nr:unnamed protein product [Owenia fusiformis]